MTSIQGTILYFVNQVWQPISFLIMRKVLVIILQKKVIPPALQFYVNVKMHVYIFYNRPCSNNNLPLFCMI